LPKACDSAQALCLQHREDLRLLGPAVCALSRQSASAGDSWYDRSLAVAHYWSAAGSGWQRTQTGLRKSAVSGGGAGARSGQSKRTHRAGGGRRGQEIFEQQPPARWPDCRKPYRGRVDYYYDLCFLCTELSTLGKNLRVGYLRSLGGTPKEFLGVLLNVLKTQETT
jgi:hypothetical protein